MRLLVLAFPLAIAACSPSTKTTNGSEDALLNAASNLATPIPSEVAEAEAFIKGHVKQHQYYGSLDDGAGHVARQTFTTEPDALTLDGSWSWTERAVTKTEGAINGGRVAIANYSLDPAELGLPIRVQKNGDDNYVVILECRTGGCINVAGSAKVVDYDNPALSSEPQSMRSPENSAGWHFGNEEEANRVARAATMLVKYRGGQTSRF